MGCVARVCVREAGLLRLFIDGIVFPHVECGWLSLVCCWLAMLAVDDIVAVIHVMPLIATIEWTSNFGLVTYDPKTAVSALQG